MSRKEHSCTCKRILGPLDVLIKQDYLLHIYYIHIVPVQRAPQLRGPKYLGSLEDALVCRFPSSLSLPTNNGMQKLGGICALRKHELCLCLYDGCQEYSLCSPGIFQSLGPPSNSRYVFGFLGQKVFFAQVLKHQIL